MIRFVSIVIVIWGLIVQPLLAAAMPAKLIIDSTHSSMAVDLVAGLETSVHAGHHDDTAKSLGVSQKAPCHKKSADDSSSEHCDKCDDDFVCGSCAASCVVGSSVSAVHKLCQ